MAEEIKRIRLNQGTLAEYEGTDEARLSGELAHVRDIDQIAVGDGTSEIGALKRILLFTAAKAADIQAALEGAGGASAADPFATKSQFEAKVDKAAGKQLSTEDFTSAEKEKLAGIAAGVTVLSGGDANTPA